MRDIKEIYTELLQHPDYLMGGIVCKQDIKDSEDLTARDFKYEDEYVTCALFAMVKDAGYTLEEDN